MVEEGNDADTLLPNGKRGSDWLLGMCCQTEVGLPLKFDENMARVEPFKFALVQVMHSYSSPRPDFIWVPVEDEFCNQELLKVNFVYPQLPYSCSHCKATGHSFLRCINNPNTVKPAPRQKQGGSPNAKASCTNNKGKDRVTNLLENEDTYAGDTIVGQYKNTVETGDVNPEVVNIFLGYYEVDADQTLADIQNADDLNTFDNMIEQQ
ncbi:hypothetical protein AgCh_023806 [Apium graveolens]